MKKNILIILMSLLCVQLYSQNLIKNPGFEQGTIPASNLIYAYALNFRDNVPNWKEGCSAEPASGNTPDILTVGATDCRASVPSSDHTQGLSPRLAGTKRYVYCGNSSSLNFGESMTGELTQSLTAGTYNVSFYGSKIAGKNYCGWNQTVPQTYALTVPGAIVEVVLRSSTNTCSTSEPVVWTASAITSMGSWQQLSGSFVINCEKAAKNYDRIEFRIKTPSSSNGFFIDDVSLTKVNITPAITGPDDFCQGTPLTFLGSLSPGITSLAYLWEIQECNSNGSVLIGSPLYTMWFNGTPGSFTFPASLNLPCNKYYRVKLAPSNNVPCEWVERSNVIRINCGPKISINSISSQTICSGDAVNFNITSNAYPIKVYNGASLVGTFSTGTIALSPTSTTTYTFTVTNGICSTSETATITVNNCPKPCFSIKNVTSTQNENSLYGPMPVNRVCLPNVRIDGSCSTNESGYHLRIAPFNLLPWTFGPDLYSNWVSGTGAVPSDINLTALIGSNTFVTGQLYVVSLTVGPGWYSAPPQFFRVENCSSVGEENSSQSRSMLMSDSVLINIYPNPTSGNVVISLDKAHAGSIAIYSLYGKLVFDKIFNESRELTIDLSNYSKGIYMIKITMDGKTTIKKIIKE